MLDYDNYYWKKKEKIKMCVIYDLCVIRGEKKVYEIGFIHNFIYLLYIVVKFFCSFR